ncbi:hypothetical protein RHSIM_Rhsim13G0077500 [Rhododendron simsii]|uniref:LTI65/LTI78 PGEED repeat domain-containing protein n=1 Tax=Rhododendron simsii TaxID=118357 RepID=A0A834L6Z9_RHOSS|nr:hypothetical protein RHSIM_Rhsim13G0077500 [Rhododendron simsii]
MSLRIPPFHLRCTLQNASKTTSQTFPRAFLTTHLQNPLDPNLLAQLHQHGSEDSEQTPYILNKLISVCAKSCFLHLGIQLHSAVIRMGFRSNVYINSALVDMYGKCGVISSCQQVFDEMPNRNVVAWNSLMSAYIHTQYPEIAVVLFLEMLKGEMVLSPISVLTVLVGCVQLEAGELGAQVHGFCLKAGFCFHVVVGTGLIDMYSKCWSIDASRRFFDEMPEKNVVTWTSLVTGYAQNQQPFEAMILVREMSRSGLKSSDVTYTSLLSSFHSQYDLDHCKQVHCCISKEGLESNSYVAVTLVTAYAKCSSSLEDFYRVCSGVTIWDQVAWSAVITGFSNLEDGHDALICFSKMRQEGITVDFFTFTSILRATGTLSALEVGKQVHCLVLKTGYTSNVCVQNALVSMYARCGKISIAKEVFLSMRKHDLISWNALISGFSHHGYGREAVEMFEQMRRTGIKPDLTTFLAVLSGCSHVGLLDKGLQYFELMKSDDALQPPKLEHYACIVDLYGRAGYLLEAEAFINNMPLDPGPQVLKALISACQVHGNTEIAVRSARKLVELYPSDPATYILLANVLANGGYWDDAAGVRKLMFDRGVRKKPVGLGTKPDFPGFKSRNEARRWKVSFLCRFAAMAQPNGLRKINTAGTPTTPRGRASPTFEQLLHGDASSWASSPTTTLGKDHEHGEHDDHHNKKSVLAKVKETAKKMKNSLSKKKHGHEDTEMAPEPYKETARQHPRAIPVVSENRVLLSSVKNEAEQEKEKPNKTITETVSDKLGQAYAAVSDATHAIASKIAGLTVATDTGDDSAADNGMMKLGKGSEMWDKGVSVKEYLMNKFEPGEDERALSQAITEAISPRRVTGDVGVVEKVKGAVNSLLHSDDSSSSQSATRATPLSPPVPVSTNLQQKKEAATSLLRNDESSFLSATRAANLSPPIPVSTNPHQATEEENHGRILQAN